MHLGTAVSTVDHTGENAALACPGHATDYPEYNLNDPFSCENHDEAWRNGCVSDTYEPGSVFKIITQVLADAGVYKLDEAGRAGFVRFLESV